LNRLSPPFILMLCTGARNVEEEDEKPIKQTG
jgi:hypothetical protein